MTLVPSHIHAPTPAAFLPGSPAPAQPPVTSPPPHLHIKTLILDGFGALSSAAIRDGFHQAWQDAPAKDWTHLPSPVFPPGFQVDIHPGLSGHDIGRRLAQVLLNQARSPQNSQPS